jgi:hypothetical protein
MDDGPTEESGSRAEWDLAVCDKPLSEDLAAPHKIQQCTTCRMGTSCRNKAHRMVWWRKARITMHPEKEKKNDWLTVPGWLGAHKKNPALSPRFSASKCEAQASRVAWGGRRDRRVHKGLGSIRWRIGGRLRARRRKAGALVEARWIRRVLAGAKFGDGSIWRELDLASRTKIKAGPRAASRRLGLRQSYLLKLSCWKSRIRHRMSSRSSIPCCSFVLELRHRMSCFHR